MPNNNTDEQFPNLRPMLTSYERTIAKLRDERDEARAEVAQLEADLEAARTEQREAGWVNWDKFAKVRDERDEARAEADRLRAAPRKAQDALWTGAVDDAKAILRRALTTQEEVT